ncbi:hypothetical protein QQ054_22050 [Oscillatoria amoena NRMC-F 0135]|nr:hypothetical protein [Oscillatoria amoena NRMC-F 0135]
MRQTVRIPSLDHSNGEAADFHSGSLFLDFEFLSEHDEFGDAAITSTTGVAADAVFSFVTPSNPPWIGHVVHNRGQRHQSNKHSRQQKQPTQYNSHDLWYRRERGAK